MTLSQKIERTYSSNEDIVDGVIHVGGMVFAVTGSAWLLWHVVGLPVALGVFVYCVGLLSMIFASAAYNMTPEAAWAKSILRRVDHSAIFIMIAATYTPFAASRLAPPFGTYILIAIWGCAAAGVALKVLFPRRFEMASIALYLAMGWMIVTVISPLAASVAKLDFWLLMGGGAVYSAGVAFYIIERIPFHKAIWHAFVLVAAILHFSAVALEFA
jgi:hemolysin III